jgi:hypothetical protein
MALHKVLNEVKKPKIKERRAIFSKFQALRSEI